MKVDIKRFLIKASIYVVIYVVILAFLWKFLLDESLLDALLGK
jgi:hypothetical protein